MHQYPDGLNNGRTADHAREGRILDKTAHLALSRSRDLGTLNSPGGIPVKCLGGKLRIERDVDSEDGVNGCGWQGG